MHCADLGLEYKDGYNGLDTADGYMNNPSFTSTNSTDLNQLICFFQDDKSYISSEWVSVQDGRIFCQFYREGTTSVKGTSFDLKSDTKYHVMLAMGKAGDGGETLGFDS